MAGVSQPIRRLVSAHPHLRLPVLVSAPMRVYAGPHLAVATHLAGGMGFIGPGVKATDLEPKLKIAQDLLRTSDKLPIGVGFQLFDGNLSVAASAVEKYKPAAAWLFVPKDGQRHIDEWSLTLRKAYKDVKIWLQVGSVADAVAAAKSPDAPDVIVAQGIDAGGHGLKKGAGILALLPEMIDALGGDIPVLAAGGISDGRGVSGVLAAGASGAVMGTRFLASREAEIKQGLQEEVVRVLDGGQTTARTTLFDKLVGRNDWPDQFDGRAVINQSARDNEKGMSIEENKAMFEKESNGWGIDGRLTAYVGSAVGLVRDVKSAGDILEENRSQAKELLKLAACMYEQ